MLSGLVTPVRASAGYAVCWLPSPRSWPCASRRRLR